MNNRRLNLVPAHSIARRRVERGQVLMKVYQEYEGGSLTQSFRTAFRYDDDGRLIASMQPSAVTGHSATLADLIGFNTGTGTATNVSSSNGVVWLIDWYDGSGGAGDNNATESTAGGATGYLQGTSISRGLDGRGGGNRSEPARGERWEAGAAWREILHSAEARTLHV